MKKVVSFIIFLLFAWICLWWFYYCEWCRSEKDNTESLVYTESDFKRKVGEKDSLQTYRLHHHLLIRNDDNDVILEFNDRPQIQKGNTLITIPKKLDSLGHKVVRYLIENPDQELVITGYQTQSELNPENDLGMERALFFQKYLQQYGVNPDKLITNSAIKNFEFDQLHQYNNGINLQFNTISLDRLAEIEKGIAHKILYSETGQENFKPDPKLINYTIELKRYLNKYPSKAIIITGHTDDTGNELTNLQLGERRAISVKNYLVSQGISELRITTTSKGELEPLVPNISEENRNKNRRIEITVN